MNKDVLFVSCTRGRKEDTPLFRSILRLCLRADMLFFENNSQGLPARYNWVLDRSDLADKLIVFVHDDVQIDDAFIVEKLDAATTKAAVVGIVGALQFSPTTESQIVGVEHPVISWMQGGFPNWSGGVRSVYDERTVGADFGPSPRRCAVLDGLLLAVDPQRLNSARFDEQFAFHFYDLDFCLTAGMAGCTLSTWPIRVIHRGGGAYHSPEFLTAQRAFVAKWQGSSFPAPATAPSIAASA